jgi:enoyl-CoA hydratase
VRLPRLIGQSRALDMILTGRGIGAEEALMFGLANRVVKRGTARAEAEALAADMARYPQLCMNNDRSSVYEQWDLDHNQAMIGEFNHGIKSLASGHSREGAARFAAGRGRGGRFDDL